MLEIALIFLDRILGGLFFDSVKDKIKDVLNKRNVKRIISQCAEYGAKSLVSYFKNEKISKSNAELILKEVQKAIDTIGVDAKLLASTSLNSEKLTNMILSDYQIPVTIRKQKLEKAFQMVLQISADILCGIGPRFSEWEREAWRRNFEELDKLLEKQEEILEAVGPGGRGSQDERFSHTYRSHVLRKMANIDASTFRVSSNLFLDLSTVFVPPEILEIKKVSEEMDGGLGENGKVITLAEARKEFFRFEKEEGEIKRESAEEFVSIHKRVAIIGLPGTGKTTFLQHFLLQVAKGDITLNNTNEIVPVLVRARQLDLDNLPSVDEILKIAEGKVIAGARPGFLGRQFDMDNVILLIDGLDEVVPDKSDSIFKWITDIVTCYPNCRYIVTSRPSGYQSQVFKDIDFKEALLCEFNQNQIKEYVKRWSKAVAIANGASIEEAEYEGQKSSDDLVRSAETNPYVKSIAMNPLMLSTLCLVQRFEGGELPNRRVVLYERCVEGLLFHWDNKRGLPPEILGLLSLDRKLFLIRRLALEMQVRGVAEILKDNVLLSFKNSLSLVGESTNVDNILNNIRDRSGILVERRPGIYGFSHLTFQEYLAALSISGTDNNNYDRLFLFTRRNDPQWEEVLALYSGLVSRDVVESLLKELIKTLDIKSVLLAGECLACGKNIGIRAQKDVINALFTLSNLGISNRNRLFRVLESLDENVILDTIEPLLPSLDNPLPFEYLYMKSNPKAVTMLYKVGKRAIEEDKKPGTYAFAISQCLLRIDSSNAAVALGKLADIKTERSDLGNKRHVFAGFWQPHPRSSGYGIFRLLRIHNLKYEKMCLCKFIDLAATLEVADYWSTMAVQHRHKLFWSPLFASPSSYKSEYSRIVGDLHKLTKSEDKPLRDCARRAVNRLLKTINSIEKG